MDDRDILPTQRRHFLMIMIGGIGAMLAAVAAWPIFRFLAPGGGGGANSKVSIDRGKIPVGGAHFFDYRGRPAVLLQMQPGQFTALTAVCTHLGCIVKWVEDKKIFQCPCHGGRFSPAGKVLRGPPPLPLESYPVAVQDGQVVIG